MNRAFEEDLDKQALHWGKVSLRGGRNMGKGAGVWHHAMCRDQRVVHGVLAGPSQGDLAW